jgi:two-component sensor histidine kinase
VREPSNPQASQLAESYEFSARLDPTTGKDFPKHLIRQIERFLQRTRKFHLLSIANFTTENRLLAYGIAIAIFLIATILRIVLDPFILPPAPFFTYYTAVLLTAFFCGPWPALFAVAISGITAWYLFLPPRGSFEVSPHAAIALLAFFTIAVLIVAVVASLHAAIKKILAQEQQTKLLAKELQHRTSNLLTVIQSIAQRSLAGDSPSLAKGREIFEARLQALARTHQQLTSSKTDAVALEEIVRSELEAFSSRTKINGDEIFLDYQQAQKFSLAVHELATNALKYGALAAPKGAVQITWSVSNNGNGHELRFRWEEHGGPPVAVPTREGFGTTLLKAAFAKSRMDYAPHGFSCEIEANVSNAF